MRHAGGLELRVKQERAPVKRMLIVVATIDVEQLERAQRILNLGLVDQTHGILSQPARKNLGPERTGAQIKGQIDAKRRLGVRAVGRRHGQNRHRSEPAPALLVWALHKGFPHRFERSVVADGVHQNRQILQERQLKKHVAA